MREIEAPVEEYLESEKDCEDLEDDYDFERYGATYGGNNSGSSTISLKIIVVFEIFTVFFRF